MPYGFNPFTGKLDIKPSTVSASYSGDVTVFRGTGKQFDLGDEVFEQICTGVYVFSGLINNGTTFTIGAGEGHIADETTQEYFDLNWTDITGNSPSIATGITYVFIDRNSNVSLQTSTPTPENLRDKIYLGRVISTAGTIIQVQDEPSVILQSTNQLYDLGKALGIFNINGNEIAPNGANLNIDKSEGKLFSLGSNFVSNEKNPHQVTLASDVAITFAYITQLAGSTGTSTISIDPTNYDSSGTITAIPGSINRATIQRVYAFPSGNIRIHYGQAYYNNISEALQAVNTEAFVINPSIPGNGVLIGLIVLIKSATDLSDPNQAQFLLASRFGQSSIGAAGRSVTSLQQAYNNSITPEIVIDANNGALTIKDAVTPIGANLFEVTDNADVPVFEVDLTGMTSGGDNAIFNANKLQSVSVSATTPTSSQVLTFNGTVWEPATPSGGGGSGDVVGPASSTDNAIVRFDSTTGKLIQNSSVTISDSGQITASGTGAGSTIFGTSTIASGIASAAIGDNASAAADYAFALGVVSMVTAQKGTAIGWGSNVDGIRGVKIGSGYAGADDIIIGQYTRGAAAGYTFGCCIGSSNVAMTVTSTAVTLINTRRATGAQYSVGVGYLCEPSGFASTSVGYSTVTMGSYSVGVGYDLTISASQDGIGIGRSVAIAHNYSIGLGAGATSTATNQFLVGGQTGPITAFYLGSGVTGATTNNVLFGITGRSGTNLTGNDLTIHSGNGTGNASGGNIYLKVGVAGASGTTANTLTNVAQINSGGYIHNPTFSTNMDFRIQGAFGYTMSLWDAGTGDITHFMDGVYHVDTSAQPMLNLLYNYRVVQAAASSAPTDSDIFTNGIMFYLDESGNNLKCRVRYSSGTYKTATIALA